MRYHSMDMYICMRTSRQLMCVFLQISNGNFAPSAADDKAPGGSGGIGGKGGRGGTGGEDGADGQNGGQRSPSTGRPTANPPEEPTALPTEGTAVFSNGQPKSPSTNEISNKVGSAADDTGGVVGSATSGSIATSGSVIRASGLDGNDGATGQSDALRIFDTERLTTAFASPSSVTSATGGKGGSGGRGGIGGSGGQDGADGSDGADG